MLKKIISGGQAGAERAALDAARALGISHGGWIPKGRLTEDGTVPEKYELMEMSPDILTSHTEMNVFDSDGTLIFSHSNFVGDSLYTQKRAMKHTKPWLHINLSQLPEFVVAMRINNWVDGVGIQVLNVTGPAKNQGPKIYGKVKSIMESVHLLNKIKASMICFSVGDDRACSQPEQDHYPESVEDIVDHVVSGLSLKDRIRIAYLEQDDLRCLDATFGRYLRRKFDMWSGRRKLSAERRTLRPDQTDVCILDVADFMIGEIWKKLRDTHRIRRVK